MLTEYTDKKILDEVRMYQVVLMCGLPGSGKSYWARMIADELGHKYLSSDGIRIKKYVQPGENKFYDDNRKYEENKKKVYEELHSLVIKEVLGGKRVVVDATYLNELRGEILERLKQNKMLKRTVIVVVKVGEETAIKRMQNMVKIDEVERWKYARQYFVDKMKSGEVSYPKEDVDGVKVLEVNNN